MGSSNRDRIFIVPHHLAQELCTGQHRNAAPFYFPKFRVIRVNRCGIDNHVDAILDVLRSLSDIYLRAARLQVIGQLRTVCVRAGHSESLIHQNLCQSTHADTADSDEMDGFWFIKINLIYILTHICAFLPRRRRFLFSQTP